MVQPQEKGNRLVHGPARKAQVYYDVDLFSRWWEHLLRHRLEAVVWSEGIPLEGENQDIPLHQQVRSISLRVENKGNPLDDEQAKPIPPQKERF